MVDESVIREASVSLRKTIAMALGELADELLGRPEIGTPEWRAEQEERDTEAGRARLMEWHLVKVRIRVAADLNPSGDALNARRLGATWQQIADACGVTRQAAYDRWAKLIQA